MDNTSQHASLCIRLKCCGGKDGKFMTKRVKGNQLRIDVSIPYSRESLCEKLSITKAWDAQLERKYRDNPFLLTIQFSDNEQNKVRTKNLIQLFCSSLEEETGSSANPSGELLDSAEKVNRIFDASKSVGSEVDTDGITPSEIEEETTKETRSQPLLAEASTDVIKTTTEKVPHAEKIHTFDIQAAQDYHNCQILTCTLLPTGEIVIGDRPNNNVKLFDKHYTYRDVLDLPGYPHDSCLSGEDNSEVLVTSRITQTIYRIKVGDDLKMKDTIVLREGCWGIACCMVGIAVVLGHELEMDNNDNYIQLLQYDGTYVKRLDLGFSFSADSRLISLMNGRQLVIADHKKTA